MPSKNSTKQYVAGGYYHIYNRGVDKRIIFEDEQDYGVFLSYLKEYLLKKDEKKLKEEFLKSGISYKDKDKINKALRMNNFYDEIILLAYCLMPNHFHFLVKQNQADSIDRFMNSLATRYSMYFNCKYKRVGPLYQSVYKAVLVETEEQWLYLSKYIHKQALASQGVALRTQPSSYAQYLGLANAGWVHSEDILKCFSKTQQNLSYKNFVQGNDALEIIRNVVIEDI
jgi:putative transposase